MATAYGTAQSYEGGVAKVRVFVSAEITNTTNTAVTVTVTAGIQYTTTSPSFTDYHIAHQQISVSSPSSESLFERTNTWYKTANFVRTSSWTEFGEGITKSVTKTISRKASAQTYTFYGETWLSCEDFYGTYGNVPSESNSAASVSLTIPALPTYTISYNANGGSGTVSSQTKTYGTALTLRSNSYTRSGYSFYHWNTKSDNSGTTYSAGASYTANAAATLYAIWNPIISYNANGGSGAPSSQTKTYGTALKLSSTKPTRTNYVFKNWNTKSDGTGTSYNPGASYTSNATATLYAQWYAPYTVTPNANGGTLASGCSALTKVYNTALTLWASSKNPTRTGYTFSKWNTKQDGTGTSYSAGASYTANASATLYAQWTANKYTISFNANGGVSAPSSVTKTYGQSVTLPTAKPTRIGHTFLGWAETAGATTAKWAAGATFSDAITANKTLYAVWRDDYTSPQITSLTVFRCDSEGNEDDEGSYASIRAAWSIDTSVDEGVVNSGTVTGTIAEEGGSPVAFQFSSGDTGVSGTATAMVSNLDTDIQYTVRVTVTDVRGASKATTRTALILRAFYIMDFGNAGQSVGIGRAASNLGLEVGYKTIFDDTVTGYSTLTLQSSNIDRDGANPSSGTQGNSRVRFVDSDNEYVGGVYPNRLTSGVQETALQAGNEDTDGTVRYNTLSTRIARDGTMSYSVSDPAAFRSAIAAVSKSGDTMTGKLDLQSSNIDRDGANPTAQTFGNAIWFVDKDGERIGRVYTVRETDGRQRVSIAAHNDNNGTEVSNTINIVVAKDGTCSYGVSNAAAFRSGIGVKGVADAPNGTTSVSSVITAATNHSITNVAYYEKNGMVQLNLFFNTTSTATGAHVIGTVVSGKRPVARADGVGYSVSISSCRILNSGEITVNFGSAPSTSSTYSVTFVYLLP